jgi:hypothetical protein
MTSTVRRGMSGAVLLATVMLAACGSSPSLPLASVDGEVAASTSVAPTSSATTPTSNSNRAR